jgi:hypothetical protein
MIAIIEKVADVAETLTAGELFTANTSGTAAIAYHLHTMPPRPKVANPIEAVVPFCLVKATGFEWHPQHRLTVELVFSIFNEDREDAMADMARLSALVQPLAVRGVNYPGYKLESVTGYPGEKETGLQTHPYYFLTVALSFLAPRVRP